ncbi:UNVERIFIED_CONTAM: hypothetical protein Slati_4231900 [Sesamum latifolium]|uniref:Uncharacterized protein n=1 Tax=Sesamum latifolium TaxID=2727402 RepID=A0AAW2TBA1_9LAMI
MQGYLPSACSNLRPNQPATFSTRDLIKQQSAQPGIYSSSDLLRLHDHVIARACCEQRACCDHSFMRPREPAAAK